MTASPAVKVIALVCLCAAAAGLMARIAGDTVGRREAARRAQAQDERMDRLQAEVSSLRAALDAVRAKHLPTSKASQSGASGAEPTDADTRAHVAKVLRQQSLEIERATGYLMLDADGRLIDLDRALCRIRTHTIRGLGLKPPYPLPRIRQALHNWLGIEAAVMVTKADCQGIEPTSHAR